RGEREGKAMGRRNRELVEDTEDAYSTDLVSRVFGEPDSAIGSVAYSCREAARCRNRVLCDRSRRSDLAYRSRLLLGEPEVAVNAWRDLERSGPRCWQRKLHERARWRYPADLAGIGLGEPEVAIGTRSYSERTAKQSWNGKMSDGAGRSDLTDTVGALLGEPEIIVGTAGNGVRGAAGGKREFIERAGGRDAADLIPYRFAKPEVVVRSKGELEGTATRRRNREFGCQWRSVSHRDAAAEGEEDRRPLPVSEQESGRNTSQCQTAEEPVS